jgi:Xaa-Pro aminopeptidase
VTPLARQERARELLQEAGCEVLLATDPGTVWWLTGFAPEIETGPSPFAPPPLAVVALDEPARLLVSDDEAPDRIGPETEVVTYPGFTAGPLRGPELAQRLLAPLLLRRRVATEEGTGGPRDLRPKLLAARAIKDEDEIEALRATLRAADAGQRRLREVATAGATELEVFEAVRQAIELEAGQRTPLLADLVSGERTALMGGPPTERTLAEGDLVLCDLAPRVGGAWGDSCATVVVGGDPSGDQLRTHRRVREALARALEAARAGVPAGELDAAVRLDLGYPHHTGHGIGGSYHEEPRVVPGSKSVLAPGMVIALEPAEYGRRFGVRLEHVVLVTDDGVEDLSRHPIEL